MSQVSVKGWYDDKSDNWKWTPEVVAVFDSGPPVLSGEQQDQVVAAIASLAEAIREGVDVCVDVEHGLTTKDVAKPDSLPPETISQEKADEIVGYNRAGKKWLRCPKCGNQSIDRISKSSGKAYQACFTCGIFLQPDGKVSNMKQQ